ncbi:protein of unknown function [Georgfuchsia toluolica]|uniref:Uncharacterized protein n=1 Tax=Georgfuchsia toluolica TaxID=424218 RepID=A0A916J433_9PROT|nr:protein of unknown function [Georgfuchsia toluolica]
MDKVFTGKASDKDTQRPELDALPTFVREGDRFGLRGRDGLFDRRQQVFAQQQLRLGLATRVY